MSFFDDARVVEGIVKDKTPSNDSSIPTGITEGKKGTNAYHEFKRITDQDWHGGNLAVKFYGDPTKVQGFFASPLSLDKITTIAEELSGYTRVAFKSTTPSFRTIDEEGNPVFPGDKTKVAGVAAIFVIAAAHSIY